MKNLSRSFRLFKIVSLIGLFTIYSIGIYPLPSEAARKVRTGTRHLSPQELQQLATLQENKRRDNLYENDQDFQRDVQAANGRNSMAAIQQVRDGAAQASQQQIQSAFLRNVQQIKTLIETGKIKGDSSAAASRSNAELQVILGSHIARLEASGDTSPETKAQITRLQRAQSASTAFAGIAATVKKFEDLSSKHESASTGGVAEMADFSTAAMNEFLTQVQTYATFRQGEAVKSLAAMPQLGPQIAGGDGAGVQEHIETMFGHEDARDKWSGVAYNTKQAVDKITKLNTAVQTIDKMVDSPEYQAIASNEYLSDDAKNMSQTMLAAGEAVKGVASILGGDMGNVPAAILSQAGDGIKSIGLAAGWAGNLEGIKRQGGRGGIASDHLGMLDDFKNSGMRVLINGSTGELTIPGKDNDDVTISGSELQRLQAAVSAFTSLTGKNPSQDELNTLAGGGTVDIDGHRRMGMNQLAEPHDRTNFDIRGGQRAHLENCLAGVPADMLTIYDVDTGKRRPMTLDEKMDHFGEKLEEMNALSQDLYGQDVDPAVFGADVINDGKWTDKMRQDLEDKKTKEEGDTPGDQDDQAPDVQDQRQAPQRPEPPTQPVEPPKDKDDEKRDPATGLTEEERIGIAAANRRRAEEEKKKAAAEKKKKEEEKKAAEAEKKRKKEEEKKRKEEEKAAEEAEKQREAEEKKRRDAAQSGSSGSSNVGPSPGCAMFTDAILDSSFDNYDRTNSSATRGGRAGPDARDMAAGPSTPSTPSGGGGGGHHHDESGREW